jgi:osmotically-inducible protein OsmY
MENDSTIRRNVIEELEFDPKISADGIGVAVRNGVVTLSGHVPDYAQKVAAVNAAQRVRGVKGVAQDLVVRLQYDNKLDDDEIAEHALNVLKWSVGASRDIKVVVDGGRVTLTGDLPWNYQKEAAERAVRNLSGVISVTNNIIVRQPVQPTAVAESIRKAFERNAELESEAIKVEVDGTTVTLSGKVKAWYEKKMAWDAAWAIPGVTTVHDNLVL